MPANPSPLTDPTAEDLRAWYRVQSAALAHDRPGEPVPSQAAVRAGLTATGSRRRLVLWLLRGSGDDPVATAALRLPDAPDGEPAGGPAEIQLTVHPAHRRLGTGSRLLATVTEAATDAGCGSLAAEAVSGTPGEGFLATRDFLPVTRLTWQRLALDEIPGQVGKLPEVPHPGYRLTAWEGAVPDALTDAFVSALRALPAPPEATGTLGEPRWDPAGVHETAELAARRGDRLLTVAALHDDGEVVGYTTVLLPGDGARRAHQYDTAVVPAHRGHGLGLWMTSEMLRRLPAAQPDLAEIHTGVPDDNRQLLAVNTALGYRPLHRSVRYRLRLRRR
ncbi:GNAT family N-acetyltransferase [Streptomyces sp. NBC_01198]|uniref:GNAT family N-acetyltransferase n=1 Tax=Streptomyces sp. NBC_01198 TaxID=2903769 RepID=UPI002E0FB617|nr:GNAT family N-acetyltransferase [Streptomyces sp. NBC_01198]